MSAPDIMNSTESLPQLVNPDSITSACVQSEIAAEVPTWLTREYLEQCLRERYNDNSFKITRMTARPALGKGENYGGVLTRIKAEYKTGTGCHKTGHYIVKTTYEGDEFVSKTMEPYDLFNREMAVYESILPKLNALLQEIGDDEQIFAETLAVDNQRSALIFEDLNVRDFVMPDRLQGLDMKLIKIALRKLAKMHATSAVLSEREGGSLEGYDRGMFNRHTDNYTNCFLGLFEACIRRVRQWGDEYKTYADKLHALKPMYMELATRVFDPIIGHINVLAHGDLWTNNIMVKYDKNTGEPVDAIIIDFQYVAWGSPAIDLFYFLNSSPKEEIHIHAQVELIQYYYNVLADTLHKLSYKANKIPSLRNFYLQIESKAFYAFHTTCVILPVQRVEETEDADFHALMKSDERAVNFKNACYKNLYTQRIIKHLLPVYERQGLLELEQ